MKALSDEKSRALTEHNGWSPARSEGYVDGVTSRRRGTAPSRYALIGIDEYCLGFRAGYFERRNPGPARSAKPAVLNMEPGRARPSR